MTADPIRTVLGLLGLALKGGNAAVGRSAVRDAARRGSVYLIVRAVDAGDVLAREIGRLTSQSRAPLIEIGTRSAIGRALGRKEVSVAAFTDAGLAIAALAAAEGRGQEPESEAATEPRFR